VFTVSADASSYNDIDKAIKDAISYNGEVDVAVANAGFSYPCYFLDAPIEKLENEARGSVKNVFF
jgi:short-subunit dehydrogenase